MTQHDMYVGTQIGNYRVTSLLASGGFGSVYLAKHTILSERTVAFKVLHAVYLNATDERESFLLEAQLLEKLKHPNILPILDVGISSSNTPYIIAEYAAHGSLRENIKLQGGRPLPFMQALKILTQVGEALQYAHQQNIIHRDLKPENILFDAQNKVLLADFGIATPLTGTSKVDKIAGTPLYMAPEQFKGVASRESDQYSLACIAYELLTGEPPFESADFMAMAYQHTNEQPMPPRQHNPALPSHVEQALLKALAKDRHARYPSVEAFMSALQSPTTRADVVPPPPPQFERKQERAAVIPPPPPPQAQQPLRRSPQQPPVYAPPLQQAQPLYRQTPPVQQPYYPPPPVQAQPYNVMSPQQAAVTMEPTGSERFVGALNYIAPYFVFAFYIGWPIAAVVMYFLSRDKPFMRFHFLQSQLLFLAYVVILFLVYGITSGSGVQAANTSIGVVVVAYLIFSVLYLIFAAMGRRTHVPIIGGFASRYADRRK